PRARDLVLQILSALEAAHASGVVHADVKSDNFIVDETDGVDAIKLVDYGLARYTDEAEIDLGPISDRLVSGTPEYMAPEVIRGEHPTPASDLYATGIILYELLT